MATSNFHNVNATKIFALFPIDGWEQKETEEWIKGQIGAIGYATNHRNVYHDSGLRSYPAIVLGDKTEFRELGDVGFYLTMKAIMRSGYYEGYNLDWHITLECDGRMIDLEGYHEEVIFDIAESIYDRFSIDPFGDLYHNMGFSKIQAEHVYAWVETESLRLMEELERVYELSSQPLYKIATASNGETLYGTI